METAENLINSRHVLIDLQSSQAIRCDYDLTPIQIH
jgi:hypothetical protein